MSHRNQNCHQSNESHTQKISTSVFVTNFPDTLSSQELWKTCSTYGTVVDVFIPFKKSKAGKKFAFVRFIKVANLDRLVENLCTIWIGRFHLYANRVRFERPPQNWSSKANHDQPPKPKARSHTGAPVGSTNTFASVLKEGLTSEPVLVLDDSCIEEKDLSLSLMGKIKEVPAIPNLPTLIAKEGFQNVKLNYLGGMWVLFTFEAKTTYDKFQAH
ncbi:RNA-directed DNA polymerase, eukaryota, nucleotide-binding alpha-beta plait domain protein, partial [Tanacetum coccineum]